MLEIRYWVEPDTLEKMIMNRLVKENSISLKQIAEEKMDSKIQFYTIKWLHKFEEWNYVRSELRFDDPKGYRNGYVVWKTTDFFRFIISQLNDRAAARKKIKERNWKKFNAERKLRKEKLKLEKEKKG